MASTGSSIFYSAVLFTITLSLQQVYKATFASSEWLTILGGFVSSLLFLFTLTLLGNFEEQSKNRAGWTHVLLSLMVALGAAASVHRVCVTTCFLFSCGILYEVNKISNDANGASTVDAAKKRS